MRKMKDDNADDREETISTSNRYEGLDEDFGKELDPNSNATWGNPSGRPGTSNKHQKN